MAARELSAGTLGLKLVTAVVLGVVSGITVVVLPPGLRELVVVASDVAGQFYAGVLLGTFLGLFVAGFTAFLSYRVYRLQQLGGSTGVSGESGSSYAPTAGPDASYSSVNDGDPPWFDMYLVGVVAALVVSVFTTIVWAPLGAGILGALASARLFGGF